MAALLLGYLIKKIKKKITYNNASPYILIKKIEVWKYDLQRNENQLTLALELEPI